MTEQVMASEPKFKVHQTVYLPKVTGSRQLKILDIKPVEDNKSIAGFNVKFKYKLKPLSTQVVLMLAAHEEDLTDRIDQGKKEDVVEKWLEVGSPIEQGYCLVEKVNKAPANTTEEDFIMVERDDEDTGKLENSHGCDRVEG